MVAMASSMAAESNSGSSIWMAGIPPSVVAGAGFCSAAGFVEAVGVAGLLVGVATLFAGVAGLLVGVAGLFAGAAGLAPYSNPPAMVTIATSMRILAWVE